MATWPSREKAVAKCADVVREYQDAMLSQGPGRFAVIVAFIVLMIAFLIPHR